MKENQKIITWKLLHNYNNKTVYDINAPEIGVP